LCGNIMFKRLLRDERGQVLPLVALAIVALFSMAGLAVDAGQWYHQQRLQQTAADSAAMAGAIELLYETTQVPATVLARARADSAINGFADGSNNITVAAPITSFGTGTNNAVTATITNTAEPVFLSSVASMVGFHLVTTATAAIITGSGQNGSCVVSLSQTNQFKGPGGSGLITAPCGVSGNDGVTGNFSGTTPVSGYPSCSVSGCSPLAFPVSDPCLAITQCAYLATPANIPTSPSCNFAVTVGPSLCVLTAASFGTTVGNSNYNSGKLALDTYTGTIYIPSGFKAFTIQHGSTTTLDLSGPTSSSALTYGIDIFSASANTITIDGSGNSSNTINGLVYIPQAELLLKGTGTSSLTVNGEVIASYMDYTGGGNGATIVGDSGGSGFPPILRHVALVQ
jgi:hypothetical protein